MKVHNIDNIINIFDNKYSLCIALARRSRELGYYITAKKNMERVNVVPPLIEYEEEDPISITMQEMREGKLSFEKVKEDMK